MLKYFGFLVLSCAFVMGSAVSAQDRDYEDEDADGLDDRTVRRAPIKEGADASRAKGAGAKKLKAKRRAAGAEGKATSRDARGLRSVPGKGARAKLRAAVAEGKLTAEEARRRLAGRTARTGDKADSRATSDRPALTRDKAGERKSGDSDSRKRGGG